MFAKLDMPPDQERAYCAEAKAAEAEARIADMEHQLEVCTLREAAAQQAVDMLARERDELKRQLAQQIQRGDDWRAECEQLKRRLAARMAATGAGTE